MTTTLPSPAPAAPPILPSTGPDDAAAPSRVPRRDRTSRLRRDRAFRPDIEGLRAVAVLLVVAYHADLGVPGGFVGVDVFLVISGFLITRQLLGATDRSGLRALPVFYAHRVRRLLPAAAVVVIASVLAFRLWGPPLRVRDVALDGLFTTFSALNYRLAAVGTDYQHMGAEASPLQHFWSLAVEEQFYVVWPLVVGLCTVLGSRLTRGSSAAARVALGTVVVAVIVSSAWASATLTPASGPWAYFSMHTRAWELGIGALIALLAPTLTRVPRPLAGSLAIGGLAAIAWSAFAYSDSTAFPGTAAWVPVLGAATVVTAGCGARVAVERFLGDPLMQCLGRVSYSWYLWHWPVLVIAPYALGHPLSLTERLAAVWISLAAAIGTFVWVEQPVRVLHWRTPTWLTAGVGLSGVVAATAVVATVFGPSTTGQGAATQLQAVGSPATQEGSAPAGPKAPAGDPVTAGIVAALTAGLDVGAVPSNLTPAPADAASSIPPTSRNGCHAGFTAVRQGACVYGDSQGVRTLVVFGDSHAEQWLPALDVLGRDRGWRVVSWTKAACPAAALTVPNPALNRTYTECDTWRNATVQRIGTLAPDLVLVSQSENVAPSSVPPAEFAASTVSTLEALSASAPRARITFLQDIPTPGTDLPGCVAEHLDDARTCTYALTDGYRHPDRHEAVGPAVRSAGFAVTDPQSWLCVSGRCPAVVGNVLVYRNESHVTVPFSRWLAPALAPLLTTA